MAAPSLPFAPAPQPMDWRPPTPWRSTELPSPAPLLPRISSLLKPQQVHKRKLPTQEEQVAPLQPTRRGSSPCVVMFMPPNDEELLRIRRPPPPSSSSRDWEHYTPPSASSPYDAAPTVSSVMRRAVYREFNPRQIASPLQESGVDARNRVRPTPTDVSSRYLQPAGPIRTQETAEQRRLFYHHDMDPHKIHEIHVPAEMPPYRQVDAEMPRKQARTSRYQVATSHTRPVFYEEEPMDMTGQKRRRVAPSLASSTHSRQPLYEGEYGLTVLETAKPLMRSRYSPLLERTAESGVLAARRRYARSDLEKFEKGDRPTSAGSRSSTESAEVARIRATEKKAPPPAAATPRASAKADAPSLTTLVLKSKEFLKSTSLVRNRHDEIDWVATFLNVGFDSSSIYALMCPLRKGRWKSEEENYTMGLLKLIENGTILLRHGQSIRGYIGQKLHSDDMRVLKKLSNCKMFHFAKLINPRLAEDEKLDMEVAGAKEGLEQLEQLKGDFLRSVQLEALVAVRKYLSDSSLRDLLNVRA